MNFFSRGVRRSAPLMVCAISLCVSVACDSERGGSLFSNTPPETYLSLYPDSGIPDTSLAPTTSQQRLHWWGDDPDGYLTGFIFSWSQDVPDPETWTYTTAYESTFALAIAGSETTYTFRISAVDDAGDADPTPAVQHFPVENSAPEVSFILGSDVPETTFTVATIFWTGTDFDGDDTIERYYWTLDDTTRSIDDWHTLPSDADMITLDADSGLVEGDHVFYLMAEDIAGARSSIARMPTDSLDVWHVREPMGDILLVDDYAVVDAAPEFYSSVLSPLGEYSLWDIRSDRNGDGNPDLLPFSTVTLTETLKLFSTVVWYGDQGSDLTDISIAISEFVDEGGRAVLSFTLPETFNNIGDPLDFVGVDSVTSSISIILNGTKILPMDPDSLDLPQLDPLPELTVESSSGALFFVWGMEPLPSARILYRLDEGDFWEGRPVIGVWHSSNRIAFFEFPLHQVNQDGNASELLSLVLDALG